MPPRLSFCGGTCGTDGCPFLWGMQSIAGDINCAGRSNERSFGVCVWEGYLCDSDTPPSSYDRCEAEDSGYGGPCGCMITQPQNPA